MGLTDLGSPTITWWLEFTAKKRVAFPEKKLVLSTQTLR